MTVLRIRPQADRDTDAAAEFLVQEANLDIGLQFLAAVEVAYQRIAALPLTGFPVRTFEPRVSGLRYWPVPGFERYLVFYVPTAARIDVICVLHGARDLGRLFDEDIELE